MCPTTTTTAATTTAAAAATAATTNTTTTTITTKLNAQDTMFNAALNKLSCRLSESS